MGVTACASSGTVTFKAKNILLRSQVNFFQDDTTRCKRMKGSSYVQKSSKVECACAIKLVW